MMRSFSKQFVGGLCAVLLGTSMVFARRLEGNRERGVPGDLPASEENKSQAIHAEKPPLSRKTVITLAAGLLLVLIAALWIYRRKSENLGKSVPQASAKHALGPSPKSPLRRESWVGKYGTLDAAHDALKSPSGTYAPTCVQVVS